MAAESSGGGMVRTIIILVLVVGGGLLAWSKYEEGAPARANNEAVSLINQGRPGEALTILDAAIQKYPGNAQLHYNRGVVLVELDRCEEALPELKRSIELDTAMTHQAQTAMEECDVAQQ
ncbi:MAG: tetratricopeptide repeat protein [Candidatus Sumerlaeia bacterium]|nr:tetratricopeptide repeat protein [Candidatus Sumerlaeia bacterium]